MFASSETSGFQMSSNDWDPKIVKEIVKLQGINFLSDAWCWREGMFRIFCRSSSENELGWRGEKKVWSESKIESIIDEIKRRSKLKAFE